MTTTTRRAVLAGLAAAPVVGLPAFAEPNHALAMAIKRHKAAYAAFSACDGPDEEIWRLSDIEAEAIDAVALAHCSEESVFEKLRHLLDRHKRLFGDDFLFNESPSMMLALDMHLRVSLESHSRITELS